MGGRLIADIKLNGPTGWLELVPLQMSNVAQRLRELNDRRVQEIKCLQPDTGAYVLGGGHRLWICQSGIATAEAYVANHKAMEAHGIIPQWHVAIPMPPEWNGTRPAEIEETYGHPHTAYKDWRHFENSLRYKLADLGYTALWTSLNDRKEIAFVADKIFNVAKIPWPNAGEWEDLQGKAPNKVAITQPYAEFIAHVDEQLKDTPSGQKHRDLAHVPYSMRPIFAMTSMPPAEAPVPPAEAEASDVDEEDDDNDSVCFRVPHDYNENECSDNCPHKPEEDDDPV